MKILKPNDILLCDANVLIDFIDADATHVLSTLSESHKIYVPIPIIDEVRDTTTIDIKKIGLLEYEPEIDIYYRAARSFGSCSKQDFLCLYICQEMGWRCLTNDKNLRKQCKTYNVKSIWGLQILLYLGQNSRIPEKECIAILKRIATVNNYITDVIKNDFLNKISRKTVN